MKIRLHFCFGFLFLFLLLAMVYFYSTQSKINEVAIAKPLFKSYLKVVYADIKNPNLTVGTATIPQKSAESLVQTSKNGGIILINTPLRKGPNLFEFDTPSGLHGIVHVFLSSLGELQQQDISVEIKKLNWSIKFDPISLHANDNCFQITGGNSETSNDSNIFIYFVNHFDDSP